MGLKLTSSIKQQHLKLASCTCGQITFLCSHPTKARVRVPSLVTFEKWKVEKYDVPYCEIRRRKGPLAPIPPIVVCLPHRFLSLILIPQTKLNLFEHGSVLKI